MDNELLNEVIKNNINRVRELISAGADINMKDNNGDTLIYKAVELNNPEPGFFCPDTEFYIYQVNK